MRRRSWPRTSSARPPSTSGLTSTSGWGRRSRSTWPGPPSRRERRPRCRCRYGCPGSARIRRAPGARGSRSGRAGSASPRRSRGSGGGCWPLGWHYVQKGREQKLFLTGLNILRFKSIESYQDGNTSSHVITEVKLLELNQFSDGSSFLFKWIIDDNIPVFVQIEEIYLAQGHLRGLGPALWAQVALHVFQKPREVYPWSTTDPGQV